MLRRKIGLSVNITDDLETFLRRQARIVRATTALSVKELDPGDMAVLAEAATAAADVLVTGDRDLLQAASPPVEVVSPRGLWEKLRRAS